MNDVSDLFWQASLEDIKRGYVSREDGEEFICLMCGMSFDRGVVYPVNGQLYTAEKFTRLHIQESHGSPFHFLLSLNKKLTGLTEHQKNLLELFYEGYNDREVAKKTGIGSTSTIRNHRFTLREKQKQAKVLLAIMELLGEQMPRKEAFIHVPLSSKNIDDRYAVTQKENEEILAAYFKEGLDGPLAAYPLKEKKRVFILRHLAKGFDAGRTYTEKEVNAVLQQYYKDYALLRRNLVDYGFLARIPDGSAYWVRV